MSVGETVCSVWCPDTFTPAIVHQIATVACPNLQVVGDASAIAEKMNDAAANFLVGLKSKTLPSEAEEWASTLASAAAALSKACGPRPINTALRIGIASDKLQSMLTLTAEVRQKALSFGFDASNQKKRGRPPKVSADSWLRSMVEIFEACFGRKAGTATDASGERGGLAPTFIAEAARRLLSDRTVTAGSPSAVTVLTPMCDPGRVARSMLTLANKERIAGK